MDKSAVIATLRASRVSKARIAQLSRVGTRAGAPKS
jgi:hypothetical protein